MSPQRDYLAPMQEMAREAGALLMAHFGKVAIEYKGDVDLVTQADRNSEELIVGRIRQQWPDHDLIGEEGSRTETGMEAMFLKALGERQVPVTVKLISGEMFQGWIEYYDTNMVRLTRDSGPNLFIFKHQILYIAEDGAPRPRS